jgi:hypothetical protein
MLLATAASLGAQERLTGQRSIAIGPVFQYWSFGDALSQDTVRVASASQLAIPLAASTSLGRRWSLDLSTAFATGSVKLESGAGASGADKLTLSGLTDVKVRLVGRPAGDNAIVTLGINAPTGLTKLDPEQTGAIRVLGAPALRFTAPSFGSGFGATAGAVVTRQTAGWAWAFGASYELRSSYTPIEATISGVRSPTDLDPGDAIHLSIGADRLLGQHRMSFMLNSDLFGDDKISLGPVAGAGDDTYKLGPAFTATWQLEVGSARFRDLVIYAVDRYRSKFTGVNGEKVEGSSGNVIDFGIGGTLGRPDALGYVMRLDGRYDGGLEVDNSITTAAMVAGGATLGLAIPVGRTSAVQPFVRAQFGQIDTGPENTSALGWALGLTIGAR